MRAFWKRGDELERRLRNERPVPRAQLTSALMRRIEASPARPQHSFRLGLAAAVSAAIVVALAAFGGLGYAAYGVKQVVNTAVQVVAPAPHPDAAPSSLLNSAAAQYGATVQVCTVQPNGKQHTITISKSAEAAYLRTHPKSYAGPCKAFRPRGAKPNVCVTWEHHFIAIWVPPSKIKAYLHRNFLAHITTTGKC